MSDRFARLQARVNRAVEARLSDSAGSYEQDGVALVTGLSLQVDLEWGEVGAAEAFGAAVRFVTWRKDALPRAERGGVFIIGSKRLALERQLSDDGGFITAACMELR